MRTALFFWDERVDFTSGKLSPRIGMMFAIQLVGDRRLRPWMESRLTEHPEGPELSELWVPGCQR